MVDYDEGPVSKGTKRILLMLQSELAAVQDSRAFSPNDPAEPKMLKVSTLSRMLSGASGKHQ